MNTSLRLLAIAAALAATAALVLSQPVAAATAEELRRDSQAALNQLNPLGGFIDDGDGTGRHANREENRAKRKKG